ncbi:MAG TPA: glycosyltransferase family 4 protein [Polyangiaceae bacterium]|nr:glycosyltransferase family 4 protein [Polyangiaceae bacterium]
MRRGKRFSALSRLPGGLALLSDRAWLSLASRRVIGQVAATLLERALAESGALVERLDIVLFTGPALEPWNSDTLRENGMGGSETMAWELARQLVALGHRVRVFAHCADIEGMFEGVEWLDYRRFHDLACDVLLVSRQPAAVEAVHSVAAKIRILWLHEAHCGDKLTPVRDRRIDAYLCLSAWHVGYFRQHYPWLDPKKVLQTRNGIEPEDYWLEPDEARDPLRVVYSSCPSRGLRIALDAWPKIRAAIPGATLHVFYGFENWERSARHDGDPVALAAIEAMKQRIAQTAGVVFHGRTKPAELARQFRISGVWAYPDWTHETSCITAMQAQAAGLGIVTSALAALNETVAERGRLLSEDPHSEAYRDAFTEATIAALRSPPSEAERALLHAYAARHFDLPRLASELVAIFRRLLERQAQSSRA